MGELELGLNNEVVVTINKKALNDQLIVRITGIINSVVLRLVCICKI